MTPAHQAELEQAARALRHELTQQDRDWDCCLSNEQASVELIVKALAAQRATVLDEVREAAIPFLHFRNWANRGCTVTMMEKVLIDLLGDVEVAGSNDAAYREYEDTYNRQRDMLYPSPRKKDQEQRP